MYRAKRDKLKRIGKDLDLARLYLQDLYMYRSINHLSLCSRTGGLSLGESRPPCSFSFPLHFHEHHNHAIVRYLQEAQTVAHVDARDHSGGTALAIAASRGNLHVIKCLVDAGTFE